MENRFMNKAEDFADFSYEVTKSAIWGVIIETILMYLFLPVKILFKRIFGSTFFFRADAKRKAVRDAEAFYKEEGERCLACRYWVPVWKPQSMEDFEDFSNIPDLSCPVCGYRKRKTREERIQSMEELDSEIKRLEVLIEAKERIDRVTAGAETKVPGPACPACGNSSFRVVSDNGSTIYLCEGTPLRHLFAVSTDGEIKLGPEVTMGEGTADDFISDRL